jgi:GT2 family glycosyltransferase
LGLFNDYTDIEHKVKTEPCKHELSLSVVIPFHTGRDILAKTVTSLTHQTYQKDRIEVIIAADANHADAKFITKQYEREIDIKLVTLSNNGWGPQALEMLGFM